METDAYTLMASHEADHWWFVGRRAVIGAVLSGLTLPTAAEILEAGCGTGGNIYLLEQLGRVSGFDPHSAALEIASSRHPQAEIRPGELPHGLPFPKNSFDLVAALDVLEHVEDDRGALSALIDLARPGGYVVVSVPTHPILFGSHDRRLHHIRRYDPNDLRAMLDEARGDVVYFGAYNTLLAPLAFALRLAEKVLPLDFGNQERKPPASINRFLAATFGLERHLARRGQIPFGLSHLAVLKVH